MLHKGEFQRSLFTFINLASIEQIYCITVVTYFYKQHHKMNNCIEVELVLH